jgi:undecaprenyl-diphosphatase
MILTSSALGIENTEFLKTFEISIQIGAIMAIVLMYIRRFFTGLEIYKKLFAAFIPAALIGFLAYPFIKGTLFNPLVVSVSLILGGIVLIIVDKKLTGTDSRCAELENISFKNAFFIGLAQCVSMIPGVSRAGATIVGGVFNGLDKKQATEFSFLLAVPTMLAAAGYDLLKTPMAFNRHEIMLLAAGLVTAFVSAWIAVKIFLAIIKKSGFVYFGWYRILIGVLFLVLILMKVI